MSLLPQLIPVEVNSEYIKNTVLTNIIKMLTERKKLLKENEEKNIKKILNTQTDDLIYKVEYENEEKKDKKFIIIKILNQKITAINKTSPIGEFLNQYKNDNKLIVVKSTSQKTKQLIINTYINTEVFLEKELMMNLIEHLYVPVHEILSNEESLLIIESYNTRKRDMPKILTNDPVARYYNMQPGQICRILRPSETSGYVPYYRLVIKGSITPNP
jgi:DNA-directed RNA polymerase subunit H (RpoH/RPB5)